MPYNENLTVTNEEDSSSKEQLEADKFLSINRQIFSELLTFIEFANDFTIGFIEINYVRDIDYLLLLLQNYPDCRDIQFLNCNFDDPNLRFLRDEIIHKLSNIYLEPDKKLVIFIRGLENAIGSSGYYPPILQDLNYIRDAFTNSVPYPILFCLPDYAITRLAQFAPDFWAWRSGLFGFITFYDFKLTREWTIPKTLQFYIMLNVLDQTVSKERIEILNKLLQKYPKSIVKTKQNIQNYLNIVTQLLIACREDKNTLYKVDKYLKDAYTLIKDHSSLIPIIIQGNIVHEMGVTYLKLRSISQALDCFNKSLELRKKSNDFKGKAETLYQIAVTYIEQGEPEQAFHYFQNSLDIQESIKNNLGKAETLTQLGILYTNQRDIETAIGCYQNALYIYNRESFPENWAMLQNNLAVAYSYRIYGDHSENLERSIAYSQESLQIYGRESNPERWAAIQNNLANVYSERIFGNQAENLETSINHYKNALKVYSQEIFPEQWAKVNNNLAVVYSYRIYSDRSENLENSINYYQQSLQIYNREYYSEQWAVVQNNLAVAYRNRILGDRSENLERAITCYQGVLEIYTQEKFPEQWATAQNNLANAYTNRVRGISSDNLEKAIVCYRNALHIYTLELYPEEWANIQNNLAVAYRNRIFGEKAENLELAIDYYDEALQVYSLESYPVKWATVQNNLAGAYTNRVRGERTENLEKAITFYKKALQVYERTTFPQDYAKILFNIAIVYQTLGRFHNAYTALETTIDTVEFLRGEIIYSEQAKQKLSEEWFNLYQCMVEVCLKLASTEPSHYPKAIEYVERNKTQNLVEILANRDFYPKGDFPESVIQELNRLRVEIALEQRILNTVAQNTTDDGFPAGDFTRLNQLREQLDRLIKSKIQNTDPTFQITQAVNPISFNEIQSLLDDRSVILEWYVTDEYFLTFIVTYQYPGVQVWKSNLDDLQSLVNLSREYLQEYVENKEIWYKKLAKWLEVFAQILHLEEILNQVPDTCDQIILVPHRNLHLLPLHALVLPNNLYFIDLFPRGVRYAPSCQLLQLISQHKRPNFSSFFAVQNPTQDLNFTDIEVETIRQIFPYSDVLIHEAATKNAFIKYPLNSINCLHLSCHGYFNFKSPLQSSFMLADNIRKASRYRGIETNYLTSKLRGILSDNLADNTDTYLTLGEIFGLDLSKCRLVTLAACETGLTDFSSTTDEYISFASGFMFAGSPTIVGSLWAVPDIPTTILMIKFYENLMKTPELKTGDISIALNQAQTWLRYITNKDLKNFIEEKLSSKLESYLIVNLKRQYNSGLDDDRPFKNPFYWAAFTAVGV